MAKAKIIVGDNRETLKTLADGSVQCVVTSPPYWGLRDYGVDDQIGVESTPEEYVENLCLVFDEVWRVLADDGTVWVNLGDSYFEKSLVGSPWMFAFAMKKRGWYLRSEIIWHKTFVMPESVKDRPTKAHEQLFLFSKNAKYFFNGESIKEISKSVTGNRKVELGKYQNIGTGLGPQGSLNKNYAMANKRDVWSIAPAKFKGAHFATFPTKLVEPCILAGTKEGDLVLDPFSGAGTSGVVALDLNRNYLGLELNADYAKMSIDRLEIAAGLLHQVEIINEKGKN